MSKSFFQIAASLSKPFVQITLNGIILEFNDAFEQIWGDAASGQNIFMDGLVLDHARIVNQSLAAGIALLGEKQSFYCRARLSRQTALDLELEAIFCPAADNKPATYVVMLEPQALPEPSHLMQRALEATEDLILIADESGHILNLHGPLESFTRYAEEELIGKHLSCFLQAEDESGLAQQTKLDQALASHSSAQIELYSHQKDGEPCWAKMQLTPVLSGDGSLSHWVIRQQDMSELVLREKEWQRQEIMFKETQKIAKTGGWVLDVATGNTTWTEEVYHIHEVPLDFDHNKANGIDFYHPEDRPRLVKALEQCITEGIDCDLVCRFTTAKGRELIVRAIGHPIHVNGEIVQLMGVFQDITQQYEAEKRLKDLNHRLQMATKAGKMGVWDYYPSENKLFWDEAMYHLYGVKKEDFSGAYDAWASTLHPDSLQMAQEELGMALRGEKELNMEFDIVMPGGSTRTIASEATVLRNAAGEPKRVIGLNYDITERKHRMDELRLFQSVVESAGDSILITTPQLSSQEQKILYANPAHEEMTGYTLEEIMGKSPKMFQGPDTDISDLDKIRLALANEENIQIELKNYKKNGEVFWVNMIMTFVRNDKGEVTHFASIQRDITKRKSAEIELRRAKTKAEMASKAKSEFLSTMSHEIRTPLNAVVGVCGLLEGTSLDLEQTDLVNTIRQGGETLLSVINNILDFSKIEAGKVELEYLDFKLEKPIEDVMGLMRNHAFSKQVELAYEIECPGPLHLNGDVGRLRQVLMNLLSNAIKFTSEGEVILKARQIEEDTASTMLEFEVADTGIGIPAEKVGRLFQSFSQVDASTTRKYGGTGLGLAIAKQLVNLMDGSIWVESEEGKGTSFFFQVRLKKAQLTLQESPKLDLTGKHILLVDDNSTALGILQSQLQSKGAIVSAFSKPLDLKIILEEDRSLSWDLAILDDQMPELDGLTLARYIRHKADLATLPMILLSTQDQPPKSREIFNFILRKPAGQSLLENAVSQLLVTQKAASTTEKSKPEALTHSELDLSTYSVLLVEDNRVNQKVALKMLQRFGVEAAVAGNGAEAVEALKTQTFDLIFMDIQMPVMDGVEATRQIRSMGASSAQPTIIALTANTFTEDRERCTMAGMQDFLGKPITLKSVKQCLQKWVPVLAEQKAHSLS